MINKIQIKNLLIMIPVIFIVEYGILKPLSKLIFPMHEKAGYHTLSVIVILLFHLGLLIYRYKQKIKIINELCVELFKRGASEASAYKGLAPAGASEASPYTPHKEKREDNG